MIGSFGRKISFQSLVCHDTIHSSFALITYGSIQEANSSLNSNFLVDFVSIFAILKRITRASALVIGSFGRNIHFLCFICHDTIHSSFALITYGLIHDTELSISINGLTDSDVRSILKAFIAIARNSALVELLSGLNVPSENHLIIHLLTRLLISSFAKE